MVVINSGDAILKLLSEIKLELKQVKKHMEQMQIQLDTLEQQNQEMKNWSKCPPTKNQKRDWKYSAKMK